MFSITSRTFEDIQSSITQIKTDHKVPIQILLLTSTLALFIWYNYRIRNYWKSKGIVQVKPQSIFGAFLDIVKKPVHELEIQRYKKYGSLYGYFEGSLPVLSVGDPQLIRKIIVKDFNYFTDTWTFDTGDEIAESTIQMLHGEEWKKVRSIIAPNFSTLKVKKMSEKVKYCANECVKNFDAFAKIGQPVDVKKFYNAFTMDVITNTAFSLKTDSQRNPSNAFVKNATDLFEKGINWRYILYLLFPQLFKLLKVSVYEPKATEFFVNVTNEVVRERRRSSLKSDDFLQFMMDNTDEQNNKREVRRKSLSEQELVSQCVFSFLAGFETTAITLCFITYFLALYPDIQEKLIEEVDAIMTSHNGNITYEVIQEMQYMDQVISETIRLCPPTVRLDRVSVKDYQIEDTGIVIPKGTIILIPIIAIQRDEKYYPDPEKFDPDRFSPEEKSKRDPFTYLPFGAGPRQCIGIKLALLEAKICLAYVLSHFRVKRCSQTKEPLEYNNGVGFLHPKEVLVNLEKREDCPLSLHLQK